MALPTTNPGKISPERQPTPTLQMARQYSEFLEERFNKRSTDMFQIPRKPLPAQIKANVTAIHEAEFEHDIPAVDTVRPPSTASTKRGWRFYGAFGTLCLVSFIIALDSTIISVALPVIARELNATAIQAFWCGTSFLLGSTVALPPVTALSHIFGRRPALLASLSLFTLGTILAGVSKTISLLLAARTLQGLGSGGILAMTYVVTTDLVSLRERGKWQGLISLMWSIGTIMGPLIGGAIVQKPSNWPWLFWINLPFCGMAFVATPICLKLQRKEDSMSMKFKQLDWIGIIVFVASLTSFLIPLSWGGVMYDWSSWRTAVPLVLGIFGLIGFGFHIKYSRRYSQCEPILRPSIFKSGTTVSGYVATIVHGVFIWCCLYYLPLYAESKGASPLGAGVDFLPIAATVAPMAIIIGLLINKTGKYRRFVLIGWFVTAIGAGLLILLDPTTPRWKWALIYLTVGVGLGVLYSAQAFAVQAGASNADLPFAASLYAFCRSLGQAIGVAIGGVIFQNEFKDQIKRVPAFAQHAEAWSKDASALVELIHQLPPSEQVMKHTLVVAYSKGLRSIWITMCILSSIALIVTLVGVRSKSLDRVLETDQGLRDERSPTKANKEWVETTV